MRKGAVPLWQCALRIAAFLATAFFASGSSAAPLVVEQPYQKDDRVLALLRAPEGLYGSVVSIRSGTDRNQSFRCTGVAVRQDWIATMADCVRHTHGPGVLDASQLSVGWGSKDVTLSSRAQVVEVVTFPDRVQSNGIALLRLAQAIAVNPAPIGALDRAPRSGVVVGWGKLSQFESSFQPTTKQVHLTVDLIDTKACKKIYRGQVRDFEVADNEFCAQSRFEGVDACAGFAGAPLFAALEGVPSDPEANRGLSIIGLVSWGVGPCGDKKHPTVYESIAPYSDWINRVVGSEKRTQLRIDWNSNTRARSDLERLNASPFEVANLPYLVGSAPQFEPLDPYGRSAQARNGAQARLANIPNIAPDRAFLYMVSITKAGLPAVLGHFCAGIVVARNLVLTAAHCVSAVSNTPEKIRVKLDSAGDLSAPGAPARVERIKLHEKYASTPFGSNLHDVALLKLDRNVPTNVVPPPIPSEQVVRTLIGLRNNKALVLGWGANAFSRHARLSNLLLWAEIDVIPNDICGQANKYGQLIDDRMMCAGDGSADACQGDSGGPLLVVDENDGMELVGLVSWGRGCADDQLPGVYVKLSPYLDWISNSAIELRAAAPGVREKQSAQFLPTGGQRGTSTRHTSKGNSRALRGE